MKFVYFTIHPGKIPPPQNGCRLKSLLFLKAPVPHPPLPNSTGLFTKPTGHHYTKYRFSPDIEIHIRKSIEVKRTEKKCYYAIIDTLTKSPTYINIKCIIYKNSVTIYSCAELGPLRLIWMGCKSIVSSLPAYPLHLQGRQY